MKKRITYEIHGQIERNCYFRIGKALVRVEFSGGEINSTGVYPAQYTTDNALFQKAIESSNAFLSGEIKRGRVELTKEPGEDVAVPGQVPVPEDIDPLSFPEVTNMQQARALLMAAPHNCTLSHLQSKIAIKALAESKGIKFPNWS